MRILILNILLFFDVKFRLWHLRLVNFSRLKKNEYINNKYCMKIIKMTKHPKTIILRDFDYVNQVDYILLPITLRTVLRCIINSRKAQNDHNCLKIDIKRLSL